MKRQKRRETSPVSEAKSSSPAKLMVQTILQEIQKRCKDLKENEYECLFIAAHKSGKDNIEAGTDRALEVAHEHSLLPLLCAALSAGETPRDASDAESPDQSHDQPTNTVTMEIKTENDGDGRKADDTTNCWIADQLNVNLESPDMSHDQASDWTPVEIKIEKEDGAIGEGTSECWLASQQNLVSPDMSHDQAPVGTSREIKTERVDETFQGMMHQSLEETEESDISPNSAIPRGDGAQYPAANRMGPSCSSVTEDPGIICGSSEEGEESNIIPNSAIQSGDGAQCFSANRRDSLCIGVTEDLSRKCHESDNGPTSSANDINTNTEGESYKCPKVFAQYSDLNDHITTHDTGEGPIECTLPAKAVARESYPPRRFKIRAGKMHYRCNMCPKAFRSPSILQGHIRSHTGERPWKCSLCAQAFSRRTDLPRHMRTHTDEKQYRCNLCSHAFAEKYNLQRHIRTHTGEIPHQCNIVQMYSHI